jgi:peptidyl-prolyl cis-trans isomerase C
LSREEVDSYFEMLALRQAVMESVAATAEVTELAPHVNVRHILVATQEEAQDVLAALQAGESFAALARAVSTDTGSGARGGELGWAPITGFVEPFADAVREAEIGEIIGPVETESGFHIIQVRAREQRELSESELEAAKNRAFQEWLDARRAEEGVSIEIFPIWTNYVPTDPPFIPVVP